MWNVIFIPVEESLVISLAALKLGHVGDLKAVQLFWVNGYLGVYRMWKNSIIIEICFYLYIFT